MQLVSEILQFKRCDEELLDINTKRTSGAFLNTPFASFLVQFAFYIFFLVLIQLSTVNFEPDRAFYMSSWINEKLLRGGGGKGRDGYDFGTFSPMPLIHSEDSIESFDLFWDWAINVVPYGLYDEYPFETYYEMVGMVRIYMGNNNLIPKGILRQSRVGEVPCEWGRPWGKLKCYDKVFKKGE